MESPGDRQLLRDQIDGPRLKRVWMLSFESSDVAHLGGLGSAVASLAKALAQQVEVCVFMPSHGRQNDPDLRQKLNLKAIPGFVSQGARRGGDGSIHPYKVGMVEGRFQGISYFLANGLDDPTSNWLDQRQIYDGELTYQKMSLFARAMRGYLDHLLKYDPGRRPDVVHANDWHSVPAGVSLKQRCVESGINVPLVFTIHLLSFKGLPWHYISEDWCGIRDEPNSVVVGGARRIATYREVWEKFSDNMFERFGAYEADFVASVSKTYLGSDVLPFLRAGGEKKSGVIYNGCDWDEGKIGESLGTEVSKEMGAVSSKRPTRSDFRRYLLTRALGEVETPAIEDREVREMVESHQGGETRPFSNDGPLVLATGRLDRQKGVDTLLQAIPKVLEVLPEAKFLLLLVPLLNRELIDSTIQVAAGHQDSVRVVLGSVRGIYGLAHISSDAYAMPSRWEPFGIAALEAMATGNPVVGSSVGGITETVLDILDHPQGGTGRLVPAEDHLELARGLICFLAMMKIEENTRRGVRQGRQRLLDSIPYDSIRELVAADATLGYALRENCRARVERHFRPNDAARMAFRAYGTAITVSTERMARS